ncbi:hypothetical protein AB0E08_49000 [Streptomyces sp. NPDC048281]|uniref:hypothetical protein n=1 Tax=Streptomyces sp. NPDC048281 TaxID=3154715 RepID=UPI00343D4A7C
MMLNQRGLDHTDVMGSRTSHAPACHRALPPPLAGSFPRLLDERFEDVVPSRTICLRTPPAFVVHAHQSRRLTGGRRRHMGRRSPVMW